MNKIFYYKRDLEKNIITSRNIKNLKVGDTIKFFGKLYSNKKFIKKVAKTIIEYKILLINSNGVLIHTNNKYIFEDGILYFSGNIFSTNFNIKNNIVNPYTTKSSILSFKKGTNSYNYAYGYNKFHINGDGVGSVKIDLELL